ncbi:putative membrane protein [Methylohalomonas lacus]|uniref:Membrane protein n=1 Tax=Methylohalomonas lacus TaxID=398773 RepID=A0AAE3L4N5_9GAMM|nr:DUF502 domain-containing protein [Methylohalomonas lacus]MCS3904163.1 putative membrane protein [Methylohalomonas lacus]
MLSLRKYLIAGLLVWLPIAATVFIIRLFLTLLDNMLLLLPAAWRPEAVLGFEIPGFGLVMAVAILLLTGVFAANLFGRKLVDFWEGLVNRIPLVRSIYVSVKQVTETLLADGNQSFRKAVAVEYPRKGILSLGFMTGRALRTVNRQTKQPLVSVFIPTTPNPTSGFIIMVPEEEVHDLDISVEEAFKYIISLGVISSEDNGEAAAPPPDSVAGADKLAR